MDKRLDDQGLSLLFREARTHTAWLDKPVPEELLREAYDLAKLGPTSANTSPMRLVFVKSPEAKSVGNVQKTMAAPVTAIVADDMRFYEFVPRLFPHNAKMAELFTQQGKEEFTRTHAFRNSTLQAGYFILACRSLGLDVGPMSGFDNAMVDAEFFPDGRLKSNFLMNVGYGDPAVLHPRNPRLSFEEACRIV